MKRIFIQLVVIAVIATGSFVACDKDTGDNNNDNDNGNNDTYTTGSFVIEATTVICGQSKIATVKAYLGRDIIATGKYEKGGFKIALPDSIDSKYLTDSLYDRDPYVGAEISDENAKITLLGLMHLYAYDNAGTKIGYFYYSGEKSDESANGSAYYVFADRNFRIWKTDGDEYVTCNFKKGWNIVYYHNYQFSFGSWSDLTTDASSDIPMKWQYEEDSKK
jgi:hypothetical protein